MNSSTRRRELCIFPAFPASGMAVKTKSWYNRYPDQSSPGLDGQKFQCNAGKRKNRSLK
jgi:hypothetical protein